MVIDRGVLTHWYVYILILGGSESVCWYNYFDEAEDSMNIRLALELDTLKIQTYIYIQIRLPGVYVY